jgi:hypothetical protein
VELVNSIPFEVDGSVWGAFLGAARIHKNVEIGETVLFHIFCLCMLLYPEPMIPLVSFYLFKIGLDNYNFKKHEHPCHIDATLSGADTTNSDDLREEHYFFPTQTGGEDLIRRYDRLRVIGRNAQKRVDQLATILEKLQSLIGWRDPRATFIFLVLCCLSPCYIFCSS